MEYEAPRNELNGKAWQLAKLMYGRNYAPTLGVVELIGRDVVTCLESLRNQLPGTTPSEDNLSMVKSDEWMNEVRFGFDYRGDSGAGLELPAEQRLNCANCRQSS